ncbi:hypothetical protein RJ55_04730 [Drechmeria coniospora]|nr:hypothetical protein RJ55_04730 [Drechmeria coniospora]
MSLRQVSIATTVGLLATGASAKTITVEVGKGSLTYSPDSITAAEGDIILFRFDSTHDVVAGDFQKPCQPASSGGFYSGTLPAGGKSSFSITVNNTDPIFYYCSISNHCQDGMVGVINQGQGLDTLDAYRSAAAKTTSSTAPNTAFGGTEPSSTKSSTTSSSKTASTTTSGAAAATSTQPASAERVAGTLVVVSSLALLMAALLAF